MAGGLKKLREHVKNLAAMLKAVHANTLERIMKGIRRLPPRNRSISEWLFRHDADRSKTQAHFDDKMGNSPVFEHLQTLQNGVN